MPDLLPQILRDRRCYVQTGDRNNQPGRSYYTNEFLQRSVSFRFFPTGSCLRFVISPQIPITINYSVFFYWFQIYGGSIPSRSH